MTEALRSALNAVLRDVQITEEMNTRNTVTDYRCRRLMVEYGGEIAAAVNSHASLVEEVERLRQALDRISKMPPVEGFEEAWRCQQEMRLNEQCRIIAIKALEKTNA